VQPIVLEDENTELDDVVAVARSGCEVMLSERARRRMSQGRQFIDEVVQNREVVYGVTTGFGKFSETRISGPETRQLQQNLIRSHAVGVGDPLPEEVVRATIFLRALALSRGHSGIRPEIVDRLLDLLNRQITPVMPEQGSLGASGDLAPLAHMALVLTGEGEAVYDGDRYPAAEALQMAGLSPLKLEAREGLALINGTQVMTALGVLALRDAEVLSKSADVIGSLSLEALRGIIDAFDERIASLRPHPGHARSAQNIRLLTAGSDFITRQGEIRVQDGYSVRCMAQVHGAVRDALKYISTVLKREIGAVTDNPLVFPAEGDVLSGGNFHGEPVALVLDHLSLAVSEVGSISERRTERLLNPAYSAGLPPFLTERGGLNSGLMITQYTAASLVAENKLLASPASADSIPSSAGQEDHVSMGTTSARQARAAVKNLSRVLAVEAISAAQGVDLRRVDMPNASLGRGTRPAHSWIRQMVSHLEDDRTLSEEVQELGDALLRGEILNAVEEGGKGEADGPDTTT